MTDCCKDTVEDFINAFDSVDSDLSINKIANAYIVKIDGRDKNENWVSKSVAVPNIEAACSLITTWSTIKLNG